MFHRYAAHMQAELHAGFCPLTFHGRALRAGWHYDPHARPPAVREVLRAVLLAEDLHETAPANLLHLTVPLRLPVCGAAGVKKPNTHRD